MTSAAGRGTPRPRARRPAAASRRRPRSFHARDERRAPRRRTRRRPAPTRTRGGGRSTRGSGRRATRSARRSRAQSGGAIADERARQRAQSCVRRARRRRRSAAGGAGRRATPSTRTGRNRARVCVGFVLCQRVRLERVLVALRAGRPARGSGCRRRGAARGRRCRTSRPRSGSRRPARARAARRRSCPAGRAGCPRRGTARRAGRARGDRGTWPSRRASTARLGRLLDEVDDAVVVVELDDAVLRRASSRIAESWTRDRARRPLRAPERDEVGERELEQVVAGDHEQVVVAEPARSIAKRDVADRAEPVVVRGRPVVVHDDARGRPPTRSNCGALRAFVTTWSASTSLDLARRGRAIQSSIGRPPTGSSSFAICRSAATAASRNPRRGGSPSRADHGARERLLVRRRWTPCSVTIAVISAAGVTSNAGFRAGKRAVTSAGSRSSIGIPAPVGGREVDGRARRDDVERDAVVARERRRARTCRSCSRCRRSRRSGRRR